MCIPLNLIEKEEVEFPLLKRRRGDEAGGLAEMKQHAAFAEAEEAPFVCMER